MKLYLSGPMSGLPAFNIPAFDEAAKRLRAKGYEIVSPAELDDPKFRDLCLKCKSGSMDELKDLCGYLGVPFVSRHELMQRDLAIIRSGDVDGVVVLPGWETSDGAKREVHEAKVCGLPVIDYDWLFTKDPLQEFAGQKLGPLERAKPLVDGDRQKAYGHPAEDFARTAGMWKAMFGWKVKAADVPLAMIAVKLSRLRQSPDHEDSQTDIAGYVQCYWMCRERLGPEQ